MLPEPEPGFGPGEFSEWHQIEVAPGAGPPGTRVTVRLLGGPSFTSSSQVRLHYGESYFGSTFPLSDTVTLIDESELAFTVPSDVGCGSYDVMVVTPVRARYFDDHRSNLASLDVLSPCRPVPIVRGINPTTASPGVRLTVDGDHFLDGCIVTLLRQEPRPTKVVTIPANAVTVESPVRLAFNLPPFDELCGWSFWLTVQNPNVRPASNAGVLTVARSAVNLQVLSYNVQLLFSLEAWIVPGWRECVIPPTCKSQGKRAAQMRNHPIMRGHDVIVLQEAFRHVDGVTLAALVTSLALSIGLPVPPLHARTHVSDLLAALREEYPYIAGMSPPRFPKLTDGGVVILSKWPIEDHPVEHTFSHCHGDLIDMLPPKEDHPDCVAAKGVLYAKIRKQGQSFHVFGTHLDAGGASADRTARQQQIQEIASFIASRQIPVNEPVIIAGDFNIDMRKDPDTYQGMLGTLNASHPCLVGSYYTTPYSGEFLDYVLTSTIHRRSAQSLNDVQLARLYGHLSDHNPVVGTFGFDTITVPPPPEWDRARDENQTRLP